MKTVPVSEVMANWAEIERQVQQGETFEVLNGGKASVRIVPAIPPRIVTWEDHLATAISSEGRGGEGAIDINRGAT